MGQNLTDMYEASKNWAVNQYQAIFEGLRQSLDAVKNWGSETIKSFQEVWTNGLEGLFTFFVNLPQRIGQELQKIYTTIHDFFVNLPNNLKEALDLSGDQVADNHVTGVKKHFGDANKMKQVGDAIVIGLLLAIASVAIGIVDVGYRIAKAIYDGINQGMQAVHDAILNAIKAPFEDAFNRIKAGIHDVVDTFNRVSNDIQNAPSKAVGGLKGLIGKIPGFADGGVVPGPVGQPLLAVVHGGEQVIPNGGSNTTSNINVTFQGIFTGSEMEFRKLAVKMFDAYGDAKGMGNL